MARKSDITRKSDIRRNDIKRNEMKNNQKGSGRDRGTNAPERFGRNQKNSIRQADEKKRIKNDRDRNDRRYSDERRAAERAAYVAQKQSEFHTEELPEGLLIGRNPVMEALKSGRGITKLMVLKDAEGSVKKILGMAHDKNIPVQAVDRAVLDRAAYGGPHQGVVAHVSDYEYSEVSDILELAAEKNEAPFIIILDGIEDPHNLGAIIRTADAAGAHGVIIPKRRAAAVTATAEKAAAGAASYVHVARVTNISQTIEDLKKAGVWIAAVDMDGDLYTQADFTGPIALVTGSEGSGISRLVKEKCDFCVSIPMNGGVNSLNASNAAAILMYEAVRQRGQQVNIY